jgi:hypothetical protein
MKIILDASETPSADRGASSRDTIKVAKTIPAQSALVPAHTVGHISPLSSTSQSIPAIILRKTVLSVSASSSVANVLRVIEIPTWVLISYPR